MPEMPAYNSSYAHPELLVGTEWLAERIHDSNVRVVDAGVPDAYARAHIPGAVSVPEHYIKDATNSIHVMPPDQFVALMGKLGIDDDTHVVGYDHNNSLYAARLWWVLDYYGHSKVSLLNGGWQKWLEEGKPVTTKLPEPHPYGRLTPKANPSSICLLDHLKECIGKSGTVVLDVRSREEYTGENPRQNKRAGHIPGAINIEWLQNMDLETHTFKPAEELQRIYHAAGITPEKEIITH